MTGQHFFLTLKSVKFAGTVTPRGLPEPGCTRRWGLVFLALRYPSNITITAPFM